MSYRPSSSSTLADNLVHWSIPVSGDDDDEEEASTFLDVLEGPGGSEKGKAKESMYVSLCEGEWVVCLLLTSLTVWPPSQAWSRLYWRRSHFCFRRRNWNSLYHIRTCLVSSASGLLVSSMLIL